MSETTPNEDAVTPPSEPDPKAAPVETITEATTTEATGGETTGGETTGGETTGGETTGGETTVTLDSLAALAGLNQESQEERAARFRSVNAQGDHLGTGRRKTAVARIRLKEGGGAIVVNRKDYKDFFPTEQDRQQVLAPLTVTDMVAKVDVHVQVDGGGPTGQAGAVRMGMARALCSLDINLEGALRDAGHLTRDSRMKERKKYGQRGARRRFQFSKR